jgi:hypothetical protein
LSEFGDALGSRDGSRLEVYLEVVNLEAVNRIEGVTTAQTRFIG